MTTAPDSEYAPDAASAADAGSGRPTGAAGNTASASSRPTPPAGLVFDDPLDRLSADDSDCGWGEGSSGAMDDDFTRFLSEKPPHHL